MVILFTNIRIPLIPINTESGNYAENLLAQHENLAYDDERFMRSCTRIGHKKDASSWMRGLTPSSTMKEALSQVPEEIRQHLLKIYIADVDRCLLV